MVDEKDLYENKVTEFIAEAENDEVPCENKGRAETKWERFRRLGFSWCTRRYYWHIRKTIGSKIIGNPKYGRGILLQIPLGNMDEGQKNAWWEARKMMSHAGIGCDSGMGCASGVLDLEWDWSLRGAYAKCKRCGYDTRDQVKEYCRETREEHIKKNCQVKNCVCRNGPFMSREELGY